MYRPSKAVIARTHAAAVAKGQAAAAAATAAMTLPANGVMLQGGTPTTPGVNATFGLGISQGDLDNLRAGKTLYIVAAARPQVVRNGVHYGVALPKRLVPSAMVMEYFSIHPNATLYEINDYLSRTQQSSEQQQNTSFNVSALEGVAAFATLGYAAGAGAAVDTTAAAVDTTSTATSAEVFGDQVAMTTATADAGGATLTDAALSGAATLGENAAKSALVNMALSKIAGGSGSVENTAPVSAPVLPVQKSSNMLPLFGAALLALYEFI